MTFSDKAVRKIMAKDFVCAWHDTTGDPDAGSSNTHACDEMGMPLMRGLGDANVQMLVLTPDGRLIHAISGYICAEELVFELEQALLTYKDIRELEEGGARIVAVRQDKIEKARKKFRKKLARDIKKKAKKNDEGLFGARRAMVSSPHASRWTDRVVKRDRDLLRRRPLLPVENFTTRMLTGGKKSHFGYHSSSVTATEPRGTPDKRVRKFLEEWRKQGGRLDQLAKLRERIEKVKRK